MTNTNTSSQNLTMSEIAARTLGDSTSYAIYTEQYDPSLLNPMPRFEARKENNLAINSIGYDVWHCYEATFLLNNSYPISGIMKMVYPSTTEMMVESKSMKLFMNSFDMCKMGDNLFEAISNYESAIKKSMIDCLNDTRVEVKFFRHKDILSGTVVTHDNPFLPKQYLLDDSLTKVEIFDDIKFHSSTIANIDLNDITLKGDIKLSDEKNYIKLSGEYFSKSTSHVFESLRSRCRHTKQKDTGIGFVYNYNISPESVFKQILSMRETNEFHEFCAEKLFEKIYDVEKEWNTIVALLYTRRGSLDINPIRYSKNISEKNYNQFIRDYIDVNKFIAPSAIQ